MRPLPVLMALLITAPLSGCIDAGPNVATIGLFSEWQLPAGSPAPVPVHDCDALERILSERALEETDTFLDQSLEGIQPRWGWSGARIGGDILVPTTSFDTANRQATEVSAREAEVTGTNNQEAGVDEADVLKTDGEWTYVLRHGTLYILRSDHVGDITEHANITFNATYHSGQILLAPRDAADPSDDRLIVITHTYSDEDEEVYAHVRVFELLDRSDPSLAKEILIEGEHMGARLVDGHAYIVVHTWRNDLPLVTHAHPSHEDLEARGMDWQDYHGLEETEQREIRERLADEARLQNRRILEDATLDDHLPRVLEGRGSNDTTPRPIGGDGCRRFLATEDATGRSVSTILALDLTGGEIVDATTQTLGSRPIVYGALDALVLAAPSRDPWWFWDNKDIEEATDLQWFDLDGLDVVPRASGRLPGIVQDSFGIDVHDGTLRVAATTGTWGRWWLSEAEREPMMTHLVLLEPDGNILVPTGMVGGIAPGERLWSARFTDTRAYLITFEQIDPLWILDLTDTSAPKILGELEIPGVSTYIHPLSDELLLTIGMGPREDGTGLDRSRLQVSLFDIRDEAKPVRADVLELSPADGWSQSAALHEHKAFTYWDRLGMLAVPMATQRYDPPSEEHGAENNSTPRKMILFHNDAYLRLVKVDPETKRLHLHGDLRQSGLVQEREVRYGSSTIERSYFLGLPEAGTVSVYTMSVLGVTAHDLDTLEEQDHVRFGPPQFERYPHFRIR